MDRVVLAGDIVDGESVAAAFGDGEFFEGVADAFGSGSQRPARGGVHAGLRHEDALIAAVINGHVLKGVFAGVAHEHAEQVAG